MTADLQRLRELMGKIADEPRYDLRCFYREDIADALPAILDRLDKAEAVCEAVERDQEARAVNSEYSVMECISRDLAAKRALAAWRSAVPRE